MKANKKLLSFALAAGMIFGTTGCKQNDVDTDNHHHYYLNYGSKTIIIRECDDYPIHVKLFEGAGAAITEVYDENSNTILKCQQSSIIRIVNKQEEEYANRLESMLIESGDAIMFNPEDFGIEKPSSLNLEK